MSGWRRIPVPAPARALAPDMRCWQREVHDGHLSVLAGTEHDGFHLSISHRLSDGTRRPGRYPSWEEIKDARYRFAPLDKTLAMLLPPQEEYVNIHPTTFHLWETPSDPKPDVVRADGRCAPATPAPVKVDQTLFASDPGRKGNCLSACVATFLNIALDRVPHFVERDESATTDGSEGSTGWWWLLVGFMAGHGLWPVELTSVDDAQPGEVTFVAGPSPRGVFHQVLYRDGVLWHDPHPSRHGVTEIREVLAWRPARHDHTPTQPEGDPP